MPESTYDKIREDARMIWRCFMGVVCTFVTFIVSFAAYLYLLRIGFDLVGDTLFIASFAMTCLFTYPVARAMFLLLLGRKK